LIPTPRSIFRNLGFLLALTLGLGYAGAAEAAAGPDRAREQAQGAFSLTPRQWAEDLDFLAAELPKRHLNLFHKIAEKDFKQGVERLKAELPSLNQDEILVRLIGLVAAIGDSHTGVGYRTSRGLPLMMYWFKDGIFVLNTIGEYKDILHSRIMGIGGRPLEDVIPLLTSLIPHENDAQVRNHLPNLLVDTAILHGLKIIPSPEAAALTVPTAGGRSRAVEMTPLSFRSQPAWLADRSSETGNPLYLKNGRLYYWYEIIPGSKALFFKYNACQDMAGKPFAEFVREMFAAADSAAVEKMIIDLRHNGGGNSAVFRPFLDELNKRPNLVGRQKTWVLAGRRTFSSAILNALDLKKEAGASFAGEPTGGKPNHFGEVQVFKLPNSGLPVSYSTKYFRAVDGDPETIVPDLLVEFTAADFLAQKDPVLEAVLKR